MLAMATTFWSAEMAITMDVAVYAVMATVNMKKKNGPTSALNPVD